MRPVAALAKQLALHHVARRRLGDVARLKIKLHAEWEEQGKLHTEIADLNVDLLREQNKSLRLIVIERLVAWLRSKV